jgi:hypothetical protein
MIIRNKTQRIENTLEAGQVIDLPPPGNLRSKPIFFMRAAIEPSMSVEL